jgi:Haem-binding domain
LRARPAAASFRRNPFRDPVKTAKRILLVLAVLALGLQLVRPEKNLSPLPPGKDDFLVRHPAPAKVKTALEVGCYDCHSNTTRYPWYAEFQPLGWWLADHVKEGKAELNLSVFGTLGPKVQGKKLNEMIDTIETRQMPLKSYTYTHRDAIFTEDQIKEIVAYLEAVRDKVAPDGE